MILNIPRYTKYYYNLKKGIFNKYQKRIYYYFG